MGNALVHGTDALTTADLSAVESFSVGTYGEGTATDSANTNTKESQQHAYERRGSRNYYNGSQRTKVKYGEYTQTGDYTESITGTTAESARYRAGYPQQNRLRDHDRYETRDDYHHHHESDLAAYRNDPKAYISDRLYEYETNRRAYRHPHEVPRQTPQTIYNSRSANKNHQARYREAYNKVMNRRPSIEEDAATTEQTMGDIYPAVTDMAYANSQDESQLDDPDPPQEPPHHYYQNNHNHEKKKNKQQELASTASDVLGSLARLEKEQREMEGEGYEGDGDESMGTLQTADTFSTLTRTIDTMHLRAKQQGISKKQLEQRIKNGQVDWPGNNNNNNNNPSGNKLEELLRQQQLQEEKLQRQLEQLRLQKERLQQLQQEENGARLAMARENCMPQSPKATTRPEVTTGGGISGGDGPEIIHLEDEAESELTVADGFGSIEDKYINDKSEDEDEGDCEQEENEQDEDDGVEDEEEGEEGSTAAEEEPALVSTHCSVDPEAAYNALDGEAQSVHAKPQQLDTMGTEKLEGNCESEEECNDEVDQEEERDQEEEEEENEDHDEPGGNSIVESFDDALQEMLSSMDDSIDLDFVAKYDEAFNVFQAKFASQFPPDSELVQNLKIAKLQKILEASYQAEADLEAQLESSADMNTELEADFQQKLRQASRNKAARTIQLQSDVSRLKKKNKSLEGKLTWDMVSMAIKRANKLKNLEASFEKTSKDMLSRENLLKLVSEHATMDSVKKAMEIEPQDDFGPKQQRRLQKLQVDNAFLNAEARVLEQKVAHQKEFAKKQAWIDEIFLKLDPKKLEKLKTRYKKKLGASF